MLSSNSYCNHLGFLEGLEDEIGDFGAKNSLAEGELFAAESPDMLLEILEGIGRLAAELNFISVEIKAVGKLELVKV